MPLFGLPCREVTDVVVEACHEAVTTRGQYRASMHTFLYLAAQRVHSNPQEYVCCRYEAMQTQSLSLLKNLSTTLKNLDVAFLIAKHHIHRRPNQLNLKPLPVKTEQQLWTASSRGFWKLRMSFMVPDQSYFESTEVLR